MTMTTTTALAAAIAISGLLAAAPALAHTSSHKHFGNQRLAERVVAEATTRHAALHPGRVSTPGIDRRIRRQTRRVLTGFFNGRLNERQVRRLMHRLTDIRLQRTFAARDGRATRTERRQLHRMLDRNNRRIRRMSQRHTPVDYRF
ncbi:MAG: hypothetical protein AAFQ45_14825 [Pseudomonadota bacterium]